MFTYFFSTIVDVSVIEANQQNDIESMHLSSFMVVHAFDQLSSNMAGVVTIFCLDENIRNMAEVLYTFRDCYIFSLCWEKQANIIAAEEREIEGDDEPDAVDILATPDFIHDDIFEPCFDDYKAIYSSLKYGTMRLERVNQLFRAYKGKYGDLARDLDIMCRIDKSTDKKWIHRTVQQIEQYHNLHLAVASAEIIMVVKDTLCLQGDFGVLQTLTEVVSRHVCVTPCVTSKITRIKMYLIYTYNV